MTSATKADLVNVVIRTICTKLAEQDKLGCSPEYEDVIAHNDGVIDGRYDLKDIASAIFDALDDAAMGRDLTRAS